MIAASQSCLATGRHPGGCRRKISQLPPPPSKQYSNPLLYASSASPPSPPLPGSLFLSGSTLPVRYS